MARKLTYGEYLHFLARHKKETYSSVHVPLPFEKYLEKEWRRIRAVLKINKEVVFHHKKEYYIRNDGHLFAILDNRYQGRMYLTGNPKSSNYRRYAIGEAFWLKAGGFDEV